MRIAREGVVLGPEAAYLHRILGEMLMATPAAAAVYAPRGRLLGEGERLAFPDLAGTLAHIGRRGAATMRDGPLAEAIVAHLGESGGLVTADDLAAYRPIERAPLEVEYRGVTVLTNPPPSSGGALIAAALGSLAAGPPPRGDVGHYRAVARAGAAANALRDERFAADLREEDCMERLWARLAAPSRKPAGSTTHISAVDADGGMASLSSSNGSGSGVVVPGTGVLLNNMLGEEDLSPGGFGLLAAGLRMTSMMAPTLLLRGGEPVLALGSAGSNRLRSAILQTMVSVIDGGLACAAAVARPRAPGGATAWTSRAASPRPRSRPSPPTATACAAGGRPTSSSAASARPAGGPTASRRRATSAPGGGRRHRRGRGDRPLTHRRVETEGRVYELDPQPVRTSLTDGPSMLWGFQVRILENGEEMGIKTCFVGRVSVEFRDEAGPRRADRGASFPSSMSLPSRRSKRLRLLGGEHRGSVFA